ncbi:type IV toxin-antitoxin system AbiEi family antitoxin domain-containing protein [Curtobacterium sp. SP.BCp]|uniref:type IV toxin-antitoxin system AbiEi family antitoxin domain-containing protein n=1 Tax=Curtobacterium sp. SP.BCp TaxID=3435230 RepID=UPI003F73E035
MSSSVDAALAALAGSQWGMVTAAQATANGIARSTLQRREQGGALERVRHGVYRLPGVPGSPLDDVRAAWLASAPAVPAWERIDDPDVVVGGAAAAQAHEIGDLYASTVLLHTRARRQSKHDDIRYSTRQLPNEDVAIVEGLPVTTRERTIADLITEPGTDLSLVADALRDAERSDADLDVDHLVALLSTHAKRLGYRSGVALYEQLRSMTRVDEERARELLAYTDLRSLVDALALENTQQVMEVLLGSGAREQVSAVIAALRPPLMANLNDQVKDAMMPLKGGVPGVRIQLPPKLLEQMQPSPALREALAKIASMPPPKLPVDVQHRIAELTTAATRAAVPRASIPTPRISTHSVKLPTPTVPTMKINLPASAARLVDDAARRAMRIRVPGQPPRNEAGADEGEA